MQGHAHKGDTHTTLTQGRHTHTLINTCKHRHTTELLRELQRRLRALGDEHNAKISKCEMAGAALLEVRASLVVREQRTPIVVRLDRSALHTFMARRLAAAHSLTMSLVACQGSDGSDNDSKSHEEAPTDQSQDSWSRPTRVAVIELEKMMQL